MKTLAQFKRDIMEGVEIECVGIMEREYDNEKQTHAGEWSEKAIAEKMQGVRYVSKVDTTGFYLKHKDDESKKRGSFCGWPKAGDLEYTELENGRFIITDRANDGEAYQKRTYIIIKK